MSRAIAPLSEAACRSAKPTDRAYKRFNGDGLSMEQLITSHGAENTCAIWCLQDFFQSIEAVAQRTYAAFRKTIKNAFLAMSTPWVSVVGPFIAYDL